jgi:hypothetical protein
MRKLLLAATALLISLCASPAQMMQDIVNANTAGGTLTPCTTTTQYDVSATPNGCNLVLFNQGLLP